jgi:lipid-binding SYLF domain-containing protein
MKWTIRALALALLFACTIAAADEYSDTIKVFKQAGESSKFFNKAYGYAVFPTIGKGAVGIGGAYGKGRVYAHEKHVGDTSMTQLTAGLQLGGEAYSQIVFFEDKRAFDEFTNGNFEFGAQAAAIAVTASAQADASTAGITASKSVSEHEANTKGKYQKGMATFTVGKGGLMYEASIGGQKFSYKPKS